ncbi:MAG: hypothetical protein AAF577_14715 [Pseudomonadota bacterium]
MTEDFNTQAAAARQLLHILHTERNDLWKEIWGETHAQCGQVVVFVLLYKDTEPSAAHQRLMEIAAPFQKALSPLTISPSYHLLSDGGWMFSAHFDEHADRESFYRATDSRRAPPASNRE